jgi:hypothetical protein
VAAFEYHQSPSAFVINYGGSDSMAIAGGNQAYAVINAPNSDLGLEVVRTSTVRQLHVRLTTKAGRTSIGHSSGSATTHKPPRLPK